MPIKERPTPEEFDELRRVRNESVRASIARIAQEHGVNPSEFTHNHNDNACYCACSTGGPCEHQWDGEWYMSEDGCTQSATCSRCGCTAMSHDMRVLP